LTLYNVLGELFNAFFDFRFDHNRVSYGFSMVCRGIGVGSKGESKQQARSERDPERFLSFLVCACFYQQQLIAQGANKWIPVQVKVKRDCPPIEEEHPKTARWYARFSNRQGCCGTRRF
jgi:hypothetical protein